jgi:hypothetical protein
VENSEFRADHIEVIEKGALKTEHTFSSVAEVLGTLTLKASRAEGVFQDAGGGVGTLKRTSIWKSNYEWLQDGRAAGTAVPRGKLSRAFNISFEGKSYGLFPGGNTFRSWTLKDTQDVAICEIRPRGAFKRGALIGIMGQLPLALVAFSYCLVSQRWQEAATA